MTDSRARQMPMLLIATLIVAGLILAGALLMSWSGELRTLALDGRAFAIAVLVEINPVAYFAIFAIGPAVGIPISLFYLTATGVLGGAGGDLGSILLAWVAIATNIALGHWIASSFARPLIASLLRSRNYNIPTISPEKESRVILLVRLSPIPFSAQNWALGIARLSFLRYMIYSWPIQVGIGTGIILVGDSLFEGGIGVALSGIFLILLFLLIAKIARHRYARAKTLPLGKLEERV